MLFVSQNLTSSHQFSNPVLSKKLAQFLTRLEPRQLPMKCYCTTLSISNIPNTDSPILCRGCRIGMMTEIEPLIKMQCSQISQTDIQFRSTFHLWVNPETHLKLWPSSSLLLRNRMRGYSNFQMMQSGKKKFTINSH